MRSPVALFNRYKKNSLLRITSFDEAILLATELYAAARYGLIAALFRYAAILLLDILLDLLSKGFGTNCEGGGELVFMASIG